MNIIWFSNVTNSVGRTVEVKTHKLLREAVAEIGDSGYVERQEWDAEEKTVVNQWIHVVVNFKPSAAEALAIESRITIPYSALGLKPKGWW